MSRNASGTYTLPSGNPVVTGTVIASTWANLTLPDVGVELTDSLSRTGKGSMLAALKHTNGSNTAPSLTFNNDNQSGAYLNAAGDVRLATASVDRMKWTAAGAEVWDVGDAAWYSVIDQKALDAVIANVATNAAGVAANAAAIANINTVGIISMWSGSAASIPAGYLLCNGANGTPNLVNKFIKGATVAGTTGGSSTHTHTDSFSVSSHTLTTSQMPSHRHAIGRANGGSGGALENRTPSGGTAYTQYTGSSGSHTHGLAGVVNSASTEPVFYTLCFIIKV